MSHSLSSWINHIKADDIDGGLAADFDGSLSGLGSELGSNPYNMSEALLALPPVVFKPESSKTRNDAKISTESTSFAGFLTSGRSLTLPGRSSPVVTALYPSVDLPISGTHSLSLPNLQQHCNGTDNGFESANVMTDTITSEWVSLMTSMNLGEVGDVEDSGECRFQYVLNAATSPATRMSEETLTYLNQGQSYEIKLRRLREGNDPDEQFLKSIVRVVFHERRLQYMEKEQLDVWKLTRPGERIVDIDIPLCKGLVDVKIDPHRLNCVEFVWDPHQTETKVAIKIHCISTEFTAKKHGGEKGVPFRIQVETYAYSTALSENVPLLLHCASCQVKVFKPKGADRKHKTDREKIERRSTSEKEKYQPSYECTVLTEIPLEQVHKYLELLNRQKEEDDRLNKESVSNVNTDVPVPSVPAVPSPTTSTLPAASVRAAVSSEQLQQPSVLPIISEVVKGDSVHDSLTNGCVTSPSPSALPITPSISSLSRKRPSETSLSVSSAALSSVEHTNRTKDILSINASAEEVASWLSKNRFSQFLSSFQNFSGADLLCLCRNDLIDICGTADGIRLYNALQARTVRPKLTIYVCQQQTDLDSMPRGTTSWRDGIHASTVKFRSRSSTPSPTPEVLHTNPLKCDPEQQSDAKTSAVTIPKASGCDGAAVIRIGGEKREMASQTCLAAKRQITEDDDEDDENILSFTANKKQRMQELELTQREVFHAVYLDSLTEYHLREKISGLFSILATQIVEMFLQGPLGIHILVTDLVVQNFRDQSSFIVYAMCDEENTGLFRVVLKCVETTN